MQRGGHNAEYFKGFFEKGRKVIIVREGEDFKTIQKPILNPIEKVYYNDVTKIEKSEE